jgi:hypothetical protein
VLGGVMDIGEGVIAVPDVLHLVKTMESDPV